MRWINRKPGREARLLMAVLPFALLFAAYLIGSAARLSVNPGDKLLPSLVTIADAINRFAFTPDQRSGDYILWSDTAASLYRLGYGIGVSTLIALIFGMAIGMLAWVRAALAPFVSALSMVPPLALLPILFIVMGLGEVSKITLIIIGVTPIMIRDMHQRVMDLPREQLIKAQTLGASSWQIAIRVVLPQILPKLIQSIQLQLGPAFLFLIAAEAISSDSGLGYRIFLVRRYLSMDLIFPYVVWITLLLVLANLLLDALRKKIFPWSELKTA